MSIQETKTTASKTNKTNKTNKTSKTEITLVSEASEEIRNHITKSWAQVKLIENICQTIYKKFIFGGKEHHYQAALEEELRQRVPYSARVSKNAALCKR